MWYISFDGREQKTIKNSFRWNYAVDETEPKQIQQKRTQQKQQQMKQKELDAWLTW